jgi:hypothetical protein
MTSFKQIAANRLNAPGTPIRSLKKASTNRFAMLSGVGSRPKPGPTRWRNTKDYRGFEEAILSDHGAQAAVESELGPHLASLLWRSHRIISTEINLFQTQAEPLVAAARCGQQPTNLRGTHDPISPLRLVVDG